MRIDMDFLKLEVFQVMSSFSIHDNKRLKWKAEKNH